MIFVRRIPTVYGDRITDETESKACFTRKRIRNVIRVAHFEKKKEIPKFPPISTVATASWIPIAASQKAADFGADISR